MVVLLVSLMGQKENNGYGEKVHAFGGQAKHKQKAQANV